MTPDGAQEFGKAVWNGLKLQPFGAMPKRELEIMLLKALLDSNLVPREPARVAAELQLTLTRAHGYLTDVALREAQLEDAEALRRLRTLLATVEIQANQQDFLMPTHDAALRIWLERKLAGANLLQGETLRPDLIRLSPRALVALLDESDGVPRPADALPALQQAFPEADWLPEVSAQLPTATNWRSVLNDLANAGSLGQIAASMFAALIT